MFDFTTENVLNDLSRVSATAGVSLNIQRLNKFLKVNAGKVHKQAGTAAIKEVATIPLAALAVGTYRFAVDVTTSGSYPIAYDRWAINKGKPFFVEFNIATATATAAATGAAILPLLKKGLIKNNGQFISDIVFTVVGDNLVVTAENEYLRFKNIVIGKLSASGEDFDNVAVGTVTTAGKEGFGTAWFLTKNLRLPTQEATRFMGEDQDERPVNGVVYNQYTFEYSAARNFTGSGAVGQTMTSKTTHVLFVPSTLAATFEASITSAFGLNSLANAETGASLNAI